ncbi:hypothetical protein KC678_05350 [Candidatus Dojkabacteria bacterium]|uniref:Uncharacterized protein n=1 Tax=Candidatus Dojkabacteria bacterium TaxID=2099670 RepID=A0A955L2H1_9BACT|nr:hypothetical protein [Candidatus Dojkabacteria bacterium]
MVPAILLFISYIALIFVGYKQTVKVRNELIKQQAFSPETAVYLDKHEFIILTTLFFFSAIHEEEDEALWLEEIQWKNMMMWFIAAIIVSIISFIFLIFSYL